MEVCSFGILVFGPPGAGKSTFCSAIHSLCSESLGRACSVINLDPSNESPPYECAVDLRQLIATERAMEMLSLGPNGSLLFALDFLHANLDWLLERLRPLISQRHYLVFDCPGQLELCTHHPALPAILQRLTPRPLRLSAAHLMDARLIRSPSSYLSASLVALASMLALQLPHINLLSRIDALSATASALRFPLEFYTSAQSLNRLLRSVPPHLRPLCRALVDLVHDFSLVSFRTLCSYNTPNVASILRLLDNANGYVYLPGEAQRLSEMATYDDIADAPDLYLSGVVEEQQQQHE